MRVLFSKDSNFSAILPCQTSELELVEPLQAMKTKPETTEIPLVSMAIFFPLRLAFCVYRNLETPLGSFNLEVFAPWAKALNLLV